MNQKTTKVETRVQRQVLMKDGKVIADSGPQITTRTREDSTVEESEDVGGGNEPLDANGSSEVPSALVSIDEKPVVGERSETRQVTREARNECFQYHDESEKVLSGAEAYKLAHIDPNKLLEPMENDIVEDGQRGALCHYTNRAKRITEKDKTLEVSRLNSDGAVVTETTRTRQQEEVDDEEIPDVPPMRPQAIDYVVTRAEPVKSRPNSRMSVGYRPINEIVEPVKQTDR